MAEVPFLGCKISLISKCDIRYEGILYCVDAKESTIALSKVKSYGTEDRADPNSGSWVAPKNEVYDIIIFRASDVKDLRVDTPEPPGLSDPAIISAHQHAYPSGGNGPSSSAGVLGNPAASSSSSSAANVNKSNQQASASAVSSSQSSAAAAAAMAAGARIASKQVLDAYGSPTNNISSGPASSKHQQHKPLLPFLPTGQTQQIKDSHFQLTTSASSNHNHNHQPPINYSSAAANGQRRSRPEPREKKSTSEDASHHSHHGSSINAQNNTKKLINHERGTHHQHADDRGSIKDRDERRNHRGVSSDRRSDKRSGHGGDHDHHHQRPHHYDRRDGRRHRDDHRQKNDDRREDRKGSRDRRRGSSNPRVSRGYDRGSNYVSNSRQGGDRGRYNDDMRRRGPSDSNRGYRKPGGDGRPPFRRAPMQGNRRPRSSDRIPGQGYRGPRKSAPLKFEGEYDFDEANKEFLELEAKLKNLKLKNENESKDGDKLSTDEPANSKSPAGDSESGSGYDSEDHNTNKNDDSNDEANGAEFYDKTKSFFDTISCEASERSSGKVGKPDWRKERQLNAETFGVSANYRRGGGYRGRVWQASSAR